MKQKWLLILTVLSLVFALPNLAFADSLTLVVNDKSIQIDSFVDKDDLYVVLLPFLQAIGDGARPVKIDLASQLITLTRGDGKLQVAVSMQTKNQQLYVSAIPAARGLGFSASLKDTTLTLKTQAAPENNAPTTSPNVLYPQYFEAAKIERLVSLLYDELDSRSPSNQMLEGVLNLSGVPVFGTNDNPADADLLEIYQTLHHPFATVIELFTLRVGIQFRLFTPLNDFFGGLQDRGVLGGASTLTPNDVPAKVTRLFSGAPSRSQFVFALVGAMGRERVKRGISNSFKRNAFWGDDALDAVQLRLLDAVMTTGEAPDSLLAHHVSLPPMLMPVWSKNNFLQFRASKPQPMLQSAQAGGSGLVISEMANDLAEHAVKTVVKETYPEAKNWLDNEVQDALGIPLVLPISPELLEAVLKNDSGRMSTLFSGLLRQAGIETAKEGARAILCGSITLYGYETKFEADPLLIHHRTDGDSEGKSLSKFKLSINFKDDYRAKVFNNYVKFAARLAIKNPPANAAELLERLGCEVPAPGPGKQKGVEWELTGDLPEHTVDGNVEFADKTTNDAGVAKAQLRAIDEHTPKAFRLSDKRTTGVVFVNVLDLLPHKWWRIQAAVQMGQDVNNGNSAGTATNRLHIAYFEPPKLLLKFKSTINANTRDGIFKFVMDADVPLEAKFNGDPKDYRSKFKGYSGEGRLGYLSRSLQSKCAKIVDHQSGKLNVWVTSENFENPQITVVLNPFIARPLEIYAPISGADCPPGLPGSGSGWLGLFSDAHANEIGTLQGGVQGSEPQFGVITRANKQTGQIIYRKTYQQNNLSIGQGTLSENTEITLEVQGN